VPASLPESGAPASAPPPGRSHETVSFGREDLVEYSLERSSRRLSLLALAKITPWFEAGSSTHPCTTARPCALSVMV
jgi:hypothetical protein